MLIWLFMAMLTGGAVALALWPLARQSAASDIIATDTAFYRARIADIDRDTERGLLSRDDAAAARAEAARLLLAASRREAETAQPAPGGNRRRLAALLALVFIPALSLGLYWRIGSPETPDLPLAARATSDDAGDIEQALARIEAHLVQNPDDGRGFEVVAPVYLRIGRAEDAAKSYRAAIRLLGETPERLSDLAEALIVADDGVVSAEARAALDKALAGDTASPKARFYRARSYEQDGDRDKALALYRGLRSEAPAGSPVQQILSERIAALGGAPEDKAAAIAAMPEGDRAAAIKTMVEGLSARLADNGADVDGWIRLMRSYVVLGEPAKAAEALTRARAALAGDSVGRERVEAMARDLKIGG